MKTYSIKNWNVHFETHETRKLKLLQWVPIPNKHDGKGFKRIMRMKDGPMIYAAWILLVQVASKCKSRGTLSDYDGPLTPEDLELKTEMPSKYFTAAFTPLCDVGWLEVEKTAESPVSTAESPVSTAESPVSTAESGNEGRKEGMEGNRRNGRNGREGSSPDFLGIVQNMNFGILATDEFKVFFQKWILLRAKGKKVKTGWTEFFQGQVDMMNRWGYATAINSISLAVTNQWDGIHEKPLPKTFNQQRPASGNF